MLFKAKVKESRVGRVLIEAVDYNEAVAAFDKLESEDIYWEEDEPKLVVSEMAEITPSKMFDVYLTKTTKTVGTLEVKADSQEEAIKTARAHYLKQLSQQEVGDDPEPPFFVWDLAEDEVTFQAKELTVK